MVDKFATIDPRHVSIQGYVGDTIKKKISIKPQEKYPFKILDARARRGKDIKLELQEVKGANGTEYALLVENLKTDKGRYMDVITLKTDSPIRPQFTVRVYGYLRDRSR